MLLTQRLLRTNVFRASNICRSRLNSTSSFIRPTEVSEELGIPPNVIFQDISVFNEVSRKKDEVVDEAWYEARRKAETELHLPILSFSEPSKNKLIINPVDVGEELNIMELDKSVFNERVRIDVIHQCVRWHRANIRQGTKKVKTISERSGTGRKPYAQKGRGRARQGSKRATQFIKGGRVHGPHPRDYSFNLNKKYRWLGIKSCLAAKFIEDNIHVVDEFSLMNERSKIEEDQVQLFMESIGAESKSIMFVDVEKNMDIFEICQSFPQNTRVLPQIGVAVYDLMLVEKLVISKEALELLQTRLYTGKKIRVANSEQRIQIPVKE